MSEDTTNVAPGGEGEVHECEEGFIWSEESQSCISATEVEDKNVGETGGTPEVVAGKDLNLTKRIERTIKDYFDMIEARLDKEITKRIDKILAQKEDQVEKQLRKSLGVEKDPVIRMSDLKTFARKVKLEAAEKGTRTPGSPTEGTGPDGNKTLSGSPQSKKVDSLLKDYGVKK